MKAVLAESDDVLDEWLAQPGRPARSRGRVMRAVGGLRFAFYGRTSSTGLQEPANSRRWQLESARNLVAGHGQIVAEFFDLGYSRRLGLAHRPEAADLLIAVADPNRGFDAIVVGEYERAFYGQQLDRLLPILQRHSVALWLPETAGPVDPTEPSHQALLLVLGAESRREVLRARFRTTTAMRTQTREHGRYLGGRPPTDTGWWMRARTPTVSIRPGDAGCTASNPTRPPPLSWPGSSPSASLV